MRTLVVGASGFLGRSIAALMVARGAEVWGTYRTRPQRLPSGCRPAELKELNRLPAMDQVVVAAGNHALSIPDLIEVNAGLTSEVSAMFPEAKMLFVSSIAVYGKQSIVISEDTCCQDPTPYGIAKLAGEVIARRHERFAIVRPTYLYGPGMPANSFIPAIIRNALDHGAITLYGRGERAQDYLHVTDAAELCARALDNAANGIYLGASGKSLTNLEVARIVQGQVPGSRIEFAGDDNASSFRFNADRTQEQLGWYPERSLSDHIEELF
jgi:UDP-glucose 4-epimerase